MVLRPGTADQASHVWGRGQTLARHIDRTLTVHWPYIDRTLAVLESRDEGEDAGAAAQAVDRLQAPLGRRRWVNADYGK